MCTNVKLKAQPKKTSKVPLKLRVSAPICLNGTTVKQNSVQKKNDFWIWLHNSIIIASESPEKILVHSNLDIANKSEPFCSLYWIIPLYQM